MPIDADVVYLAQTNEGKISRNKIVFYIDELWQLDLCDTRNVRQYNDGVTFILTIIDEFSKVAFARALKDKKGPTVLSAFTDVRKRKRAPQQAMSALI